MQVTNLTQNNYQLDESTFLGAGATITVANADYDADDQLAENINSLVAQGFASVSGQPGTFPRPTDPGSTQIAGQKRLIVWNVTDPNGSPLTTGDGKVYFRVPAFMNGHVITSVAMAVSTVSSSGVVTVQIRRSRGGVNADVLSTLLTIDANEEDSKDAATAAVINGTNDDLATGDKLWIDVDGAGTNAKGLVVEALAEDL